MWFCHSRLVRNYGEILHRLIDVLDSRVSSGFEAPLGN